MRKGAREAEPPSSMETGAAQLSPFVRGRLTSLCGTPLDPLRRASRLPTSTDRPGQPRSFAIQPCASPIVAKPWSKHTASKAEMHALSSKFHGSSVGSRSKVVWTLRATAGLRLDKLVDTLTRWYWPFTKLSLADQGMEAYTPWALLLREALYNDVAVSAALDSGTNAIFSALKAKGNFMEKHQYVTVFSKFYRTLVNDRLPPSSAELRRVVEEDWAADRLGKTSISKKHLRRLLFQMVDMWTVGISSSTYTGFIGLAVSAILEKVPLSRGNCNGNAKQRFCFRDDRAVRHYDPIMMSHTSRKIKYFHCKLSTSHFNAPDTVSPEKSVVNGGATGRMRKWKSPPKSNETRYHILRVPPVKSFSDSEVDSSVSERQCPPSSSGNGQRNEKASPSQRGLDVSNLSISRLPTDLPSTSSVKKHVKIRIEGTVPSPNERMTALAHPELRRMIPMDHNTPTGKTKTPRDSTHFVEPRRPETPRRKAMVHSPTIRLALGRSRTRKEVEHLCHSMGLTPCSPVHQLDGCNSSQNFEVNLDKMWQTRIKRTQINVATRSPRNRLRVHL